MIQQCRVKASLNYKKIHYGIREMNKFAAVARRVIFKDILKQVT